MQIQRKWIAVGIGVLLLVLGGISVLSLSEQEEVETMAASDFREENEYTDTEKDSNGQRRAVRVYDTALYLRARPPTDPFHASEVLPGETTMETVGPEEIPAGGNAGAAEVQAEPVHTTEEEIPRLAGVLSMGEDKRAILTYKGTTRTVKKGDKWGKWQVTDIMGNSVSLSTAAERRQLSLQAY